jgi:hypothetical protein
VPLRHAQRTRAAAQRAPGGTRRRQGCACAQLEAGDANSKGVAECDQLCGFRAEGKVKTSAAVAQLLADRSRGGITTPASIKSELSRNPMDKAYYY